MQWRRRHLMGGRQLSVRICTEVPQEDEQTSAALWANGNGSKVRTISLSNIMLLRLKHRLQ